MTDEQAERICTALETIASQLEKCIGSNQRCQLLDSEGAPVDEVTSEVETFGSRLRQLRMNYNFTQRTFAAQFGVVQSAVGNWESGRRVPNLHTIKRIAAFFDVTTDYLIGASDTPHNLWEEDRQ